MTSGAQSSLSAATDRLITHHCLPILEKMMMSFAEAVEFINPAYNPNVASFFPQPVLNDPAPIADSSVASSNEGSVTVAAGSLNCCNTTNQQPQPHGVELRKKKTTEIVRCEICNVSCNSISMLERHKMGKKHRKKMGEKNSEALMLDSVKSDECMEGVEITNVTNIDMDAIPGAGLEGMNTTIGISCGTQTMPEPFGKCSDTVSEIHIPKQQGFSTSIAENACNKKDVDDDEIMSDKSQSAQSNADISADLSHLNSASKACVQICTVCNVFSNSQENLEKHLAGKTHARKVKYLNTLMSSSVSVYPHNESHTLKLASDAISQAQADRSSVVPVGYPKIQEPILSESVVPVGCSKIQKPFHSESVAQADGSSVVPVGCSKIQKPFHSKSVAQADGSSVVPVGCLKIQKPIHSESVAQADGSSVVPVGCLKIEKLIQSESVAQADGSSVVPVGCSKIQEPSHSESRNVIPSPKLCTICNIKCSTQEIFHAHLSGRKHASKDRMLGSTVHKPSITDQGAMERASKRGKVVQFAYCDVCKIYCNSSENLATHTMGKKHIKQLEKLGK